MICPHCAATVLSSAIAATPAVGGEAREPDAWRIEWVDGMLSFSVRKPFDDPSTVKTITPLYAALAAAVGGEARKWIIDLIHNEYDPKPPDYRPGDNWNDGAEEIADQILERLRNV